MTRCDLFARRLRALAEQLAQQLAGLGPPPPVLADRLDQMPAELRGADPCAQIVGRVEAGVHVGEVAVAAVADPGRGGEELLVAPRRPAVVCEPRPEAELVAKLRLVAAVEQRLEEHGRLGVLGRLRVGETEVACVPPRLARNRLDDVGIDLGERVVARDPAEGVRQRCIDAAVMERVAGLVQERLVVVQPALRARDQVDDLRRVTRDHAGARRLLGPVVEIELDVRRSRKIEAELGQRRQRDLGSTILRVGRLERREPAHVRRVEARRNLLALGAEQLLEPARAKPRERHRRVVARSLERRGQLAQRDALLLLVAFDRVADPGQFGRQLLCRRDQLEPVGVEAGACVRLQLAELLAVAIGRQHRELRLRVSERHLLAPECDALCELPVLELVLPFDESR